MFINYMIYSFVKVRERLVYVAVTRDLFPINGTLGIHEFISIKAGLIPKFSLFCTWWFLLVYIDNTDLGKMIGCIGDDIATRNIIRQVICEDIVN